VDLCAERSKQQSRACKKAFVGGKGSVAGVGGDWGGRGVAVGTGSGSSGIGSGEKVVCCGERGSCD
jgi:hypothetical protein